MIPIASWILCIKLCFFDKENRYSKYGFVKDNRSQKALNLIWRQASVQFYGYFFDFMDSLDFQRKMMKCGLMSFVPRFDHATIMPLSIVLQKLAQLSHAVYTCVFTAMRCVF